MGEYVSPGEDTLDAIVRKLRDDVDRLLRQTRAGGTSVDTGDFVVQGGGNFLVRDGGDVIVEDDGNLTVTGDLVVGTGGDVEINSGGDVNVNSGGNINVNTGGDVVVDGGALTVQNGGIGRILGGGIFTILGSQAGFNALYDNGSLACEFGPISLDGVPDGTGLNIQAPSNEAGADVFSAYRRNNGERVVWIGNTSFPITDFWMKTHAFYIEATGGGGDNCWIHSAGTTRLSSSTFTVEIAWSSTGSAANMFLDANGRIWKSTSSRRYKDDIKDAEVDPELFLKLRPRTWKAKKFRENDEPTDERYIGFIAEEVDELEGGDMFVTYSPHEGEEEEAPDGLQYDRMIVMAQATIKQQQEEIEALKKAVTDLQSAVKSLQEA
jgi:hypothetical protein